MVDIGIEPEAWKKILEPRHIIHFVGATPEYWQTRVADKYFRIDRTQEITYDRAYILAPAQTYDIDLRDHVMNLALGFADVALYPGDDATLYEILLGMKSTSGSVLAYPRAPPNEWFIALEEGGYIPDPTNNYLRYLSPFTEEITPADTPQVRIHTIHEEEAIGLRLFNDTSVFNKLVLVLLVNRCLMREVPEAELTEKELERARELFHFGIMSRGAWAERVP